MIAVPVSWQKGSIPLTAVSALRRNCNATYLSFSDASGSFKILATCSLCSRRNINSTSWKACWLKRVRASFETLMIFFPSNSPTVTPSLVSNRYSVSSLPTWNIGAYLNSGVFAIMFCKWICLINVNIIILNSRIFRWWKRVLSFQSFPKRSCPVPFHRQEWCICKACGQYIGWQNSTDRSTLGAWFAHRSVG